MERGNLTWLQPWQAGHQAGPVSRPLRAAGKAYRGVNVLMLWAAAMEKGYSCPIWMTYKQAQELGGQVRKGEKGSLVVYADTFTRTATDEGGEAVEIEIPFMKGYTVFNVEQVDGLPAHFYATLPPINRDLARLQDVERFFATTGAVIRHGGDMAYYNIARDIVQMPEFQTFRDAESYYAELLRCYLIIVLGWLDYNARCTSNPIPFVMDFDLFRVYPRNAAMQCLPMNLRNAAAACTKGTHTLENSPLTGF